MRGGHKPFTKAEVDLAETLYTDGMKLSDIADQLGRTASGVGKVLRLRGVKMRKGGAVKGVSTGERTNRKYTFDDTVFDTVPFGSKASYFIGLLLTDGCVRNGDEGGHKISLAQSEPRESIVYQFRDFLKCNKPLYITKPKGDWNRSHQLHICSKKLFYLLGTYGVIPQKTSRQVVDDRLRGDVAFTRGIFDGDGSIYITRKHPHLQFSSTSLDMADYWITFCRGHLGTKLKPDEQYLPSGKLSRGLHLQGREAVDMASLLYGDGEVSISTKQAVADAIIAQGYKHTYPKDRNKT